MKYYIPYAKILKGKERSTYHTLRFIERKKTLLHIKFVLKGDYDI